MTRQTSETTPIRSQTLIASALRCGAIVWGRWVMFAGWVSRTYRVEHTVLAVRFQRASAAGFAALLLNTTAIIASHAQSASGYTGDFRFSDLPKENSAPALDTISGVTTLTGVNNFSVVNNGVGATIINNGTTTDDLNNAGALVNNAAYTANVASNTGTITNTPSGSWNGDLNLGANVKGGSVINQGTWTGALNNSGGSIDNQGSVSGAVNNASGVFTNEGTLNASLANGGTATNSGSIKGSVTNSTILVNNASGVIGGALTNSGTTTNNGIVQGDVQQTGTFTNNTGATVKGGLTNSAGTSTNNGTIAGSVEMQAGAVTNNSKIGGNVNVAGAAVQFTNSGTVAGSVAATAAGSTIANNATGVILSGLSVGAKSTATNNGTIKGGVANSGAFANSSAGVIADGLTNVSGTTTNGGAISGPVSLQSGTFINNNLVTGAVTASATALVTNNGAINGAVITAGKFVNNGTGVVSGALTNTGAASNNGVITGAVQNSGNLANNAGARIAGGLNNTGGSAFNAGSIAGGATVSGGVLTTTGILTGGLIDKGLVNATGTVSGVIVNTGSLVVSDGTDTLGKTLTIAPGSSVTGSITIPVDLAAGKTNSIVATGANVSAATVNFTGVLTNPKRNYWGSLAYSDVPIAADPKFAAQLKAMSDLLYVYGVGNGKQITQTINPGLAATAGNNASALLGAINASFFGDPSEFLRAPAETSPNLFAAQVWTRGAVSSNSIAAVSTAGSAPSFNASRMDVRLGGAQFGLDGGLFNLQNSGMSLHLGVTGGEILASSSDAFLSGATARDRAPFLGVYAALGGDGFFGVLQARYGSFTMVASDPALGVVNQTQHARGMTYSGEFGYNLPLGGGLFLEPSAGLIVSRMKVDDQVTNLGTLTFSELNSELARVGLRAGAAYQMGSFNVEPYVLGAVWHEFQGRITTSIPNGPTITQSPLGTFEQVGLGFSATVAKMGLTVYAQGDARLGANMRGIGAKAGINYTF